MRTVAVAALALVVAGCDDGQIAVTPESNADYGNADLLTAIDTLSSSDRSPAAYRRFAETVAELGPRFDEPTAQLAERNLVFMAVPLLVGWHDRPLDEQMEALALTVWPTALAVDPKPGESPQAYLERVCNTDLALDCKDLVPEAYPLAINAMVWRRFKNRGRDVMTSCRACRKDPAYEEALDKLERYAGQLEVEAQRKAELGDPGHWPVADAHAEPWAGAPLFHVDADGKARFRGVEVTPGRWRRVLKEDRRDADVLGVLLEPDERVRTLRQIMKDARAAGYTGIALQVRGPVHPYPLRQYSLALERRRGRRDPAVNPRDIDTIQILVQMLDAALVRGEGPLVLP